VHADGGDSGEAGWYNSGPQTYAPSTRWALMRVAPARDWHVFQPIVAEHWEGVKHAHPRYQTAYYDDLVATRLACGNPALMGEVEYRCLRCGQGPQRGAMRCKSSLCLRGAKV
jgi:hypothetical protein